MIINFFLGVFVIACVVAYMALFHFVCWMISGINPLKENKCALGFISGVILIPFCVPFIIFIIFALIAELGDFIF